MRLSKTKLLCFFIISLFVGVSIIPSITSYDTIDANLYDTSENEERVKKHIVLMRANLDMNNYRFMKEDLRYLDDPHFDMLTDYTVDNGYVSALFERNRSYDMVIIAPSVFNDTVQSLGDHKNNVGVNTMIVTTEDIYDAYTGVDEQEQIKYYISDAIQYMGIQYVLLIGNESYVPVRYSNLDDGAESSFPTDLYYADVFSFDQYGTPIFQCWDSNGNGIFAEWTDTSKDILDLYPDVYLGRIPCSTIDELSIYVDKIITYETQGVGDWFNTVLLCGGDTCISGDDVNEGEAINNEIATILGNDSFSFVKLWASKQNLTVSNITDTINNGVGFIDFSGMGDFDRWMTHPHNDSSTLLPNGGYTTNDVMNLSNEHKLPVVMLGGCYCANITHQDTTISEAFLFHPDGGSIGVLGSTALTYYYCGEHWNNGFFGYLETRFFYNYNHAGFDTLGQLWAATLMDYINNFPCMQNKHHCKTVQSFILLGDPSLKIGGYQQPYPVQNSDTGKGFNSIQEAIDDDETLNGHTIEVSAGIYYENIVINKSISLIGEDKNNTVIDGGSSGTVVFVSSDWVTISGFTIQNSGSDSVYDSGIELECVSNNFIIETVLTNNSLGIYLSSSSNNTITGNTVSNNEDLGIYLISFSNYNNITSNTVSNNSDGIFLEYCSNNTITGTKVSNVTDAIVLYYSSNNTITGNIASNNFISIGLNHLSNHNTILNNTLIENYVGIVLVDSSNNTINGNTISNNNWGGIYLYSSSDNNTTSGNTITNNGDGIYLSSSSNNTIANNTLSNNSIYGISLQYSNDNTIYDNYFDNTNNYYDDGINTWNISKTPGTNIIGGPYLGGNYWSCYTGVDTDGDGLGNTQIPHGPGDHLPLTYVNLVPIANFSWLPTEPTTLDIIEFTDFSIDPDGFIESWFWDFGDDNTSTMQHPTHQYMVAGNYTVCLTVIDNNGSSDFICKIVTVTTPIPPLPPENLQVQHTGSTEELIEPGEMGNYSFDIWTGSFTGPYGDNTPVDIYYPLTMENAPYPGLVLGHGFTMSKSYFETWGEYYASWGYVIAVPSLQYAKLFTVDHEKCAYELLATIDFLKDKNNDIDHPIHGLVDEDNLGLTGFSLGAKASILAVQYETILGTNNVKAVAPMAIAIGNDPDPLPDLYLIDIPVQLQAGEHDLIAPPEDNSLLIYDGLENSSSQYFLIHGANHNQYADMDPWTGGWGDGQATISREEQHKIARKYSTSFFNYYLKNQLGYGKYLYGTFADQDVDDEVVVFNQFKYVDYVSGSNGTEHNLLTWDASPDDTGQVSHYTIYRSEYQNGSYELISSEGANSSTNYSYLDVGKGTADDILWWYLVRAVDVNGLEEENVNAVQEPEGLNLPPLADFTWIPTDPTTLDTIQFNDTSTDPDGYIVSWLWDFGDSNTSTLQHPMHQYMVPGDYMVCLTVTDDDGASDTYCDLVVVIESFDTPVISNVSMSTSDPLDTDPAFGWILISCEVTGSVDLVTVNMSNPDGTWENTTMSYAGDDVYYLNTTFTYHGLYEYSIWAVDTMGNIDESAVFSFLMPPNWDINMDGIVNIFDVAMLSTQWQQTGPPGWIREDINNDGIINIFDVALLSTHWMESWI